LSKITPWKLKQLTITSRHLSWGFDSLFDKEEEFVTPYSNFIKIPIPNLFDYHYSLNQCPHLDIHQQNEFTYLKKPAPYEWSIQDNTTVDTTLWGVVNLKIDENKPTTIGEWLSKNIKGEIESLDGHTFYEDYDTGIKNFDIGHGISWIIPEPERKLTHVLWGGI